MKDSLQLRYRLIPYTYSMNYLTHYESLPLVTPLYFEEPECNEAYNVKNEFYFGTQLLACPITKPASKVTAIGEFDAWLPEGLWFDFNTGFKYKGGRMFKMHRTLQEVPVFAKAGGIIPMDNAEELKNQITNPTDLQVRVYPGADGHFAMYEDDGNEIDPSYDKWAVTNFNLKWNENEFTVQAAKGNIAVIPQRRSYEIKFYSVNNANAKLYINGRNAEYISDYDDYSHTLTVKISETSVTESIKICFENIAIEDNDKIQHAYNALQRMQLSYDIKHHIYNILKTSGTNAETLAGLYGRKEYSREVIDVIAEIILAS